MLGFVYNTITKINEMSQDYYELLGLERNASKDEIKKAFRKKAQQYHPDKQDGDEEKFKQVNEAYTVLSNEKKRAQYDQFGSAAAGGMGGGAGAQGFGGFGGFGQQGGGMEFDMNDIFDMFGGGGRSGQRRSRRGADISTEITIDFAESIFGVEKTFTISKEKECGTCDGTGAKNKKTKTCSTCNGNGQVSQVQQTIMGTIQRQVICPECDGVGQIPEAACSTCRGTGSEHGSEEVNVKIPAGIEDGQQLRLSDRGEYMKGGENGDLYILVRVTQNRQFEKIGNDIKTDKTISISQAVLGDTVSVDTVDGSVKIKVPAGTSHGSLLRVKDQGVGPKKGKRGNLYVQIEIEIPKKINKEEKGLFEQLQKISD